MSLALMLFITSHSDRQTVSQSIKQTIEHASCIFSRLRLNAGFSSMSKWFKKAAWEDDLMFTIAGKSSSGSMEPQEDGASSEDECAFEEVVDEAAGDELANVLLEMHYAGRMSAKTLCIVAWYAARAGAKGAIGNLALRPSSSSGHFQRKVDRSQGVNLKAHGFYLVDTPGQRKWEMPRSIYPTPIRLPHEVVEAEIQTDPTIL